MKKIIAILTIIMVFILPFSVTFNEQKAHANIISKPLTITAKKVAKELAQNSAVEMAEHILFEKAMKEFLNSDLTDPGYKAVCLDGAKSYDDCPANKRAQVKETLSSADKTNLSSKVEQVLERKTNTSSKWGKFLDWFVPIFLLSGLVATFDAMLDPDSEGLIDDIAQEALIESGLLKSLKIASQEETLDFTKHVESVNVKMDYSGGHAVLYRFDILLKTNASMGYSFNSGSKLITVESKPMHSITLGFSAFSAGSTHDGFFIPTWVGVNQLHNGVNYDLVSPDYWRGQTIVIADYPNWSAAYDAGLVIARNHIVTTVNSLLSDADLNKKMNLFISFVNMDPNADFKFSGVTKFEPVEVITDYGKQPGIEKIKNPDGTVRTPGIDSFKYTHGSNEVYPSTDSTTGWKDKTTGIDINVVEDDIVVDGGDPPIDPEAPPAEDDDINTDKDKDKIKKKSRDWSALLTTRFPFSLPWDFLHLMKFLYAEPMTPHWEIKGTEKVPFNLKMDLKFMEPYAPWFRTFIFLSFVMSVIFLHGRFMGGSK